MSRTLARFLLATSSLLAFTFLLTPAAPLGARGRGPNSLQPDSSATVITMVLTRSQPISHGNYLILPSPNGNASPYAKGGTSGGGSGTKGGKGSGGGGTGGGGGSTGGATVTPCCGGSLSFSTTLSSPYNVNDTITPYNPPVETPSTTQPEAEEEVAVDPSNPGNVVEAVSDFSNNGYNNTKWAISTDGGTYWSSYFVPTDPISSQLVTSDNAIWDANSDPVVAMDKSGNVYLSDLYIKLNSSGEIVAEGFYVSAAPFSQLNDTGNFATLNGGGGIRSANTYPVLTNLNNGSTFNIEDKPWITVDNNSGTVYASWSHFTGCQNQYNALAGGYVLTCSSDSIWFAYSTSQGQKWTVVGQISPSTQDGAVQGSQPAVGPDGTVYVAYEFMGSNNQRQQYLAVSTGSASSGNLSFSTNTPFAASPPFYELGFAGCNTCSATYRVNSFPNIAISPMGTVGAGNVYLVYGAQTSNTSLSQVNFMACTGSCTSSNNFYGPGIISANANQEAFFPAISVDSTTGVIHTCWLDTRNSPSSPTDPDYLDVYASYLNYDSSTNSFTPSTNARVTPKTDNASVLAGWGDTSFIGDYIGIAAGPADSSLALPAEAHPVWTNAAGALGYLSQGLLKTRVLPLP